MTLPQEILDKGQNDLIIDLEKEKKGLSSRTNEFFSGSQWIRTIGFDKKERYKIKPERVHCSAVCLSNGCDSIINILEEKKLKIYICNSSSIYLKSNNHLLLKWLGQENVKNSMYKDIGFESDDNEVSIFYKDKSNEKLHKMNKSLVASEIVNRVIAKLN